MSSSFLIFHPDVPVSALSVSMGAMPPFLDDRPFEITYFGNLYPPPKMSVDYFAFQFDYDLGTGNSRTVDHFLLGGMDMVRGQPSPPLLGEATLSGSNDGVNYTEVLGTLNLSTRTYFGRNQETALFTSAFNTNLPSPPSPIPAYRYFRVRLGMVTTRIIPSKIYFGQALDMGKEPDFYDVEVATERDADTWVYPRGHTIMSKAFYPGHRVTVEWDGVSDAKANEFMEKLLTDPYQTTVYLYTKTHLDPLFDNRMMYCRILSEESYVEKSNEAPNWNKVYAVFEEIV